MPDDNVSLTKLTVPFLYVIGMVSVIAGAVYAWDDAGDRITMLEQNAAFHVKIDELQAQLKLLQLQRVHDKMSEVQSAIAFYEGVSMDVGLSDSQYESYENRRAELDVLRCQLAVLNLGDAAPRECIND